MDQQQLKQNQEPRRNALKRETIARLDSQGHLDRHQKDFSKVNNSTSWYP